MPVLTNQQIGELRDLLVQVFTTSEGLVQLMQVEMGVTRRGIVSVERGLLYVAYDLIEWLEPREKTLEFLRALRKVKGDVPEVVRFCEPFLGVGPASGAAPGA